MDEIEISHLIDFPRYRHLLKVIRKSGLRPVASDLPVSMWETDITSNQWMTDKIAQVFNDKKTKLFVILGNLHVIKPSEKIVRKIGHDIIRYRLSHLSLDRKTHLGPALKTYSIVTCIDDSAADCDYRKKYGGGATPLLVETKDFNGRLELMDIIKSKSMTGYRCDCGQELNFFENTISNMKKMSAKKRVRLGEEKHTIVFYQGEAIEIHCPEIGVCIITEFELLVSNPQSSLQLNLAVSQRDRSCSIQMDYTLRQKIITI